MKPYQIVIALPFAFALGVGAHALISRGVKLVLWAWSPLASGEPEAASYDRRVYHTAIKPMMQLAAAAALAGLPWLIGMAAGGAVWWWLGLLAVCGVVAFDVLVWERVAISAHYLWFQRGFRSKVHQVALETSETSASMKPKLAGSPCVTAETTGSRDCWCDSRTSA